MRTGIAWLEESALLTREENRVQVFPSSLRVASVEEAREKLGKENILEDYRRQLLSLVEALISADADEGISTDELMGVSGLSPEQVRAALYDLERVGIASNDTALTAFVHVAVERSSVKRLEESAALEAALIDELRESAPDLDRGEAEVLHLRHATQRLKDQGHQSALPEKLWRIIRGLSSDGRNEESGIGSVALRRLDAESIQVRLQRRWPALEKTARLRRTAADRLLRHLLACLPPGSRGADCLAETTLGKLVSVLMEDLEIRAEVQDPSKLLDRALLWLHEQEVIRLNKGLAVFRPAMTIRLGQERRNFGKSDFAPLRLHYDEQVLQIHVMAEYVQRGLKAMAEALGLTLDYFTLPREKFLEKWLPGREKDLARQTTPASWQAIVESLVNPVQQRIVTDDREQTNVLVLAGPGSGKTRVLVHRIAYLVRVKRENPRGILALAYNRHAATEIRMRLESLIDNDARGVTVMTCHALAMRLVGVSFRDRAVQVSDDIFKTVLRDAVALLKGEGLPPEEADEQRERLLAGFRWILVDEYQDVGPDQYELISALAGRTLQDEDGKLSLFAVGDDDQNLYAFSGASVEFIRRFEADYKAKPEYLTENYRSTAHIIDAANQLIDPAAKRMKAEHQIRINRARVKAPSGGDWEGIDPVSKGRVQILPSGKNPATQAVAVMTELRRLSGRVPDWDWACAAVISREWSFLEPIRSYCEIHQIPVQMADERPPQFWRLRETQALIGWLHEERGGVVDTATIREWLDKRSAGPWWVLLREAVSEYELETSGAELPKAHFIEWLVEWGRETRRRQTGLMLLTAHRAKGVEFDHVVVLDGAWEKRGKGEDADAARRLFYVAMTRARKSLTLAKFDAPQALLDALPASACILRRPPTQLPEPMPELARRYQRLELSEVNLGFAGGYAVGHKVHKAIDALNAGDALKLQHSQDRWELVDQSGTTVGRLAKSFSPPKDMVCVSVKVAAILQRYKEDAKPEFAARMRCDRWEVVVPDMVFAPNP